MLLKQNIFRLILTSFSDEKPFFTKSDYLSLLAQLIHKKYLN